MKFFQHLLVAPAAIGLIAPIAANATEINLNKITQYSSPNEQVRDTSSFSDVHPTDWSFQALKNIHKSHGCKAVMPVSTVSRLDAAALLNACLSNVPSLNEQEQALVEEWGSELAQIRGTDLNGNDGSDSGIYAGSFSAATTISGEANFIIGGNDYEDGKGYADQELHMIYSYKLNSLTSFDGEDALKVSVEAGNAESGVERMATEGYVIGTNNLAVSNMYYSRPVGDFLVAAGPMFEMDALVSTTTSSYSNDGFFNGWWYAPNNYSNHPKDEAPGFAISYINDNGFNAGISFMAVDGANATKGIAKDGNDIATYSIGYDGENWGGGAIYTQYDDPSALFKNVYDANGNTMTGVQMGDPVFIGLGSYWNITDKFDISVGVDFLDFDYSNYDTATVWSVGADYDLPVGTISAGMATIPSYNTTSGAQDDAGMAYEIYYSYPLSDGITIKPMVLIHDLDTSGTTTWVSETIYGIETTFSF